MIYSQKYKFKYQVTYLQFTIENSKKCFCDQKRPNIHEKIVIAASIKSFEFWLKKST